MHDDDHWDLTNSSHCLRSNDAVATNVRTPWHCENILMHQLTFQRVVTNENLNHLHALLLSWRSHYNLKIILVFHDSAHQQHLPCCCCCWTISASVVEWVLEECGYNSGEWTHRPVSCLLVGPESTRETVCSQHTLANTRRWGNFLIGVIVGVSMFPLF